MPDKPASKEIHLRQLGKPLGSIFLGVAIVVLIVGGRRYFEGQVCFFLYSFDVFEFLVGCFFFVIGLIGCFDSLWLCSSHQESPPIL